MSLSSPQQLPTERRFGMLFTLVFATMTTFGYIKGWNKLLVALCLGFAFLMILVTFTAPKLLAPLNRAWFDLGQLMGRIVSPIVLGAIFFFILTPVALITRIFGRDELRLNRKAVDSYWIEHHHDAAIAESFKNQF